MNPNNIIQNLTARTLSSEEYEVLRHGLKDGLATHENASGIIATAESVWDQISRQNISKETHVHIERAKNSLRALAFNLTDLHNNQIFKDKNKINIIKNLRKDFVQLKPNKRNGIVLIKATEYYTSVEKLFSDQSKFKQLVKDPTPARLATLQRYLKQLNKSGELHDNTFKKIQPQSAKIARAHGLPKMHKHFDNNPSFWPIVDTTGTRYYSAGKYLSELLNPLTRNEYSLRDSFDATNRINRMLPLVQENEECRFVSLDVVSLFTNVPLYKTVNIILKRVNSEKLIQTSLSKHSLKTLILDTCQKTTLSFNNKLYEQIDRVSMGGSLGPVLANIISTECEKVSVYKLMKEKCITFYTRYVDDTLLIIKKRDINYFLNQFNSFDKNLKFTIDTFEKSALYFLDIKVCPNRLGIYHRLTQTGQYVHIPSYTSWRSKTSWIRSIVIRPKKI